MASKKIKIVSALALVAALACLGLRARRIFANRHEVQEKHEAVKLWDGGPHWATTNIGAEKPEDYGLYFWWGDTMGYKHEGHAWVASDGSRQHVSFDEGSTPTIKENKTLQNEGWTTSEGVLAPEHDAAHVHWGGNWRMPTEQEMFDLNGKCDWTLTTTNGVKGYVIRGRGDYASNCIFLPAADDGVLPEGYPRYSGQFPEGWYWSSVPYLDSSNSWILHLNSVGPGVTINDRFRVCSVRPVQGFAEKVQSFTASLDPKGGVGGTVSVTATYGSALPSISPPTRCGYTFGGYWTKANGGGTQYYDATGAGTQASSKTATTILYAKWTADSADRAKVQLWKCGPYWATTNLGAEKPEDYGLYFWWGDTVGYKHEGDAWVASDGSSRNFLFSWHERMSKLTHEKKKATLQAEGWTTLAGVLAPEHDAAHIHWGGNWRMPTELDMSELSDKCDWTWTTMNGVNGYVIRGRGDYASNRIFLPATGYGNEASIEFAGSRGSYWSSVPYKGYCSWNLEFDSKGMNATTKTFSGYHGTSGTGSRYDGRSIRPVQGFAQ